MSTTCSTAPRALHGAGPARRRRPEAPRGLAAHPGELAAFPDFPVKLITEKAITIRSARGHSFNACELAVAQLASHRYPLEKLATHRYGIDQVDHALRVLAYETDEDAIHVSMMPELVGLPGGRVR
ncbi:hypothetical protein ACFQV4_29400 [Streptomyces thermocarboxydus]